MVKLSLSYFNEPAIKKLFLYLFVLQTGTLKRLFFRSVTFGLVLLKGRKWYKLSDSLKIIFLKKILQQR